MKPITKKIIIISVCLIIGGAVLTGIGVMLGGWPGVALSRDGIGSSRSTQAEPVTLEKTRIDAFSKADILIDSYSNIQILPSDDGHYYLEYLLDKSYGTPEYRVNSNTLMLHQTNTKKDFHIFLAFSTFDSNPLDTYVNLYVPEEQILDSMKMYNDTGNVSIDTIHIKDADITVDYGDVQIKDSSFDSLKLTMDTSDFSLHNSEIGTFSLENDYGDNTLKDFQCDTANLELDSGSLYLDAAAINQLTCNSTYTDITLLLPEKLETYTFDISVDYGDIDLPRNAPKGFYSDRDAEEEYYQTEGTGGKAVNIYSDTGDVEIQER